MTELRITGRSEDGSHLLLTDHEEHEFTLRISDNLRATINQPRLASVNIDDEPRMSIKELQARLRAGSLIDELAREANWSIEKVERFAGPILQERAYILSLANAVIIKRDHHREASTFIEVVENRLASNGVTIDQLEWNTHRRDDGQWVIKLSYPNRDGNGNAVWFFDQQKRTIVAEDDGAAWIMGESIPAKNEPINHGLIYSNPAPTEEIVTPTVTINSAPTPRLSVIRENEDNEDGVKKRAAVPSWDEIMFGTKKESTEE